MSHSNNQDINIQISAIKDLYKFYNFIEKIGGGAFGTVYKAENIRTKEEEALKIGDKINQAHKERFYQEIKILRMVKGHANIVTLHKVYETQQKICLVMEFCPRELSKVVRINKPTEGEVKIIMTYLVSTVAFLHNKGIVHRDLKLENILIGTNPNNPNDLWFIKLTDFGLSAIRKGVGFESMFNAFCGTLMYIAPELITKSYSQKCDIWSLGVIMYYLLEEQFPFQIKNMAEAVDIIQATKINYKTLKCSSLAADLIAKCLHKNPALRISAGEILIHPFIKDDGNSEANLSERPNVITMMNNSPNRKSSVKIDETNNRRSTADTSEIIVSKSSSFNQTSFNQSDASEGAKNDNKMHKSSKK